MIKTHGTAIAIKTEVGNQAILLKGLSGTGKSDLALRLISRGAKLISDDFVVISDNKAKTAENIPGLLEIRGVGVVKIPYIGEAPLKLIIELVKDWEDIERMPELSHEEIDGVNILKFKLFPFEISAEDKVLKMLEIANNPEILIE